MKALLLAEYGRLEYTDVPDPAPADDEVLVRVERCGICGSDVHGMDGSTGRRIPPVVMGHEASGTVEAVGSRVKQVKRGERVTFDSTIFCGECRYCRSGKLNLCDHRRVLGVSCLEYRADGAFAEFVAVPQRTIYPIPAQVSFDEAALAEPLSVAAHAVALGPSLLGRRVAVVGAGVIGSFVVAVVKASGASCCVAIDPDDTRRTRATSLGADIVVDPTGLDRANILSSSGGEVDVVFEAVGVPATVDSAVALSRKGGTVVLVGNVTPVVPLSLQSVVTREIALLGSCGSAGEYDMCLAMLAAGAIDTSLIVSAVAPLSEGASWFSRLYDRERGLLKVLLAPHS